MPISSFANRIAPRTGGYEPQRVNHWNISIKFPDGIGGNSDVITLSLHSFDPPAETVEALSIPYANEDRKVAGRVTRDNSSLVLKDYVQESTYKLFRDWQKRVFNAETGALGYAKDYKGTATLNMLGPDLKPVPKKSFMVHGVWPSKVSMSTLDQSGSDQVQITVDLVYDAIDYPG